jgi:hypothetical protein
MDAQTAESHLNRQQQQFAQNEETSGSEARCPPFAAVTWNTVSFQHHDQLSLGRGTVSGVK